jgi:hypothetical protein
LVKKAGDLLSAFFDEATLDKAKGYGSLFSSWPAIAGENLAAHSRIVELERSVLLIEADHPGWIQILQTKQKNLLHAIRRRFPEITVTAISFRLSRKPPRPAPEPAQAAPIPAPAMDPDLAAHPVPDAPAESGTPGGDPPEASAPGGDPYAAIHDEAFKQTLMRLERSVKRGKR